MLQDAGILWGMVTIATGVGDRALVVDSEFSAESCKFSSPWRSFGRLDLRTSVDERYARHVLILRHGERLR